MRTQTTAPGAATAQLEAADQAQLFRDAMSNFPSGVTIVTTVDASGRWWGYTASAFCSLSADPRLVLTCLANTANCYPAFEETQHWTIHIVHHDQTDVAMKFASRGADKFADLPWDVNEHGVPILRNAAVTLECEAEARYPGGDHLILVGKVITTTITERTPTVYFRRDFHALGA